MIEFSNVTFSYPTREDVKVLQEFSLRILPNQTVALVGPSGEKLVNSAVFCDFMGLSVQVRGNRLFLAYWSASMMSLMASFPSDLII